MKSKVYDIITDALEKAKVKFDANGESIWVDSPQGRTVSVNVTECENAEEESPQQQEPSDAPEAVGEDDDDLHRFTVSITATVGTIVEVAAPDESTAEDIVNQRWARDEIKLDELSLHESRVDCTGRLD